jgi:hypothetical protein
MSLTRRRLEDFVRAYPFTCFYFTVCVWAVLVMALVRGTR